MSKKFEQKQRAARRLFARLEDLMSVPMAIYLQDVHPITEAMEIAQFAEESAFHAVAGRFEACS